MKILLVQTSFLGDTILSSPVVAGLKKIYPQAELWMLTTPAGAELVGCDPLLAGMLLFDKRGRDRGLWGLLSRAAELRSLRFDRAYSLHRSYRTALLLWLARIPQRIGFSNARLSFLYHHRRLRQREQHEVLRNLSLLAGELDVQGADQELRVFPAPHAELPAQVRDLLAAQQSYVVIAPGSHWETKRWHADGFKAVAQALAADGLKTVLIGRAEEAGLGAAIENGISVVNLIGRTSLPETAAVISTAALMICNDSMVLHLASAFKVPTVVVFCSTIPGFGFGPWRNRARVVEKTDLSCKPCGRHGHRRCPLGTEACMREVDAEEVLRAARELLKEGESAGHGRAD